MKVKSNCILLLAIYVVAVRKYIRLRKNPNTYYGDLKQTVYRNFETFPVLKSMTKDVIFDINLFDRITIDEPAEVSVEGGTETGRRIDFWQLIEDDSRKYNIIMSIFITSDQAFRIFERMLQQYI